MKSINLLVWFSLLNNHYFMKRTRLSQDFHYLNKSIIWDRLGDVRLDSLEDEANWGNKKAKHKGTQATVTTKWHDRTCGVRNTLVGAEKICRGITKMAPVFVVRNTLVSRSRRMPWTVSFKENIFQQPGGRNTGPGKLRTWKEKKREVSCFLRLVRTKIITV